MQRPGFACEWQSLVVHRSLCCTLMDCTAPQLNLTHRLSLVAYISTL